MNTDTTDDTAEQNDDKEPLYQACAIIGALGGAATLATVLTPAGLFVVGVLLLLGVIDYVG